MFKKLFTLSLLVVIALAVALAYLAQRPLNATPEQTAITVEIEKGDTLSHLAHEWAKQGWLPSAELLLLQARLFGGAKNIRPGEFEIPTTIKTYELLPLLAVIPNKQYNVRFIEGTRLSDALARLQQAPKLVQDITPLTLTAVQELLQAESLPEGLIYPDTYAYHAGDSASSILLRAHQRLNTILQQQWRDYQDKLKAGEAQKLPYDTATDALIMASIVEKETGQASERPEIAGVFVRRLEKNMRLETDPTVIYGLGEDYEGNLKRSHLYDRSNPYNTYRNKGLPPTPIALAGREAINAALNPKAGDTLFFVAKGDGSHYFSTNLEQHNRAVREYQILKRKENYRSAPAPANQ